MVDVLFDVKISLTFLNEFTPSVDVMDILMFKAGVKRKMLQVRLNELFASSYRFMSEGLQWTTPNEMLNEEAEIVSIQVIKKV